MLTALAMCLGSAPGRPRRLRTNAGLRYQVTIALDLGLDGAEAGILDHGNAQRHPGMLIASINTEAPVRARGITSKHYSR
jgi:hypothetical protein